MPKKIDIVKEDILIVAGRLLELGDAEAFSVRKIAKECGIGMGTVYNYFPSKHDLILEIMRVHITEGMNKLKSEAKKQDTVKAKTRRIFEYLNQVFISSNKKLIKNIIYILATTPCEKDFFEKEADIFRENIIIFVTEELKIDDITATILINSLVFFAHKRDTDFEELWKVLEKLLQKERLE